MHLIDMDRVNAGRDHQRLILRDHVHNRLGRGEYGLTRKDLRPVDHPGNWAAYIHAGQCLT